MNLRLVDLYFIKKVSTYFCIEVIDILMCDPQCFAAIERLEYSIEDPVFFDLCILYYTVMKLCI